MPVYSVPITNSKEPVIFDVTEMPRHNITVLVLFIWLGRYVPSTRPECNFNNRVAKVHVQHFCTRLLLLSSRVGMMLSMICGLVIWLERSCGRLVSRRSFLGTLFRRALSFGLLHPAA